MAPWTLSILPSWRRLFELRKGCDARPPTRICLEDLGHLPASSGEFECVAFVAPYAALPGVILDGQTDLQATLIIKVAAPANDRSAPERVWDALVEFDRAWKVAGRSASL